MHKSALLIAAVVLVLNGIAWAALNRPQNELPWTGKVAGMSFSPYRADQDPLEHRYPSEDQIQADLAQLAGHTRRVRTYSSSDIAGSVPRLAARYGMSVTAGAWLGTDKKANENEITALINSARVNRNVERVIVGNETLLRADLTPAQLTRYLQRVRHALHVPVSTAEPWHVWLKHPELAKQVDFIAIHLLPYWEGVAADQAVEYALTQYEKIKKAFPNKHILIAEVGWPSHGNRLLYAQPSLVNEARFVRRFLNAARDLRLDYFLMEAFDQPWKRAAEGSVGPYWGIFNSDREPKFSMTGTVVENPYWVVQAVLAMVLALLPMLWFLRRWDDLRARGRAFFALLIQIAASLASWTAFAPWTHYLTLTGTLMWGVLLPAQLALLAVMLINGFELTEMTWRPRWLRSFRALAPAADQLLPKVSLHLPIHNEPAEMVQATLDSLARLDYPDFEVLVVDNNTADPAAWRPVADYCARLGPRFRFFSLGTWPGYKAGALNFALRQTDARARVIGVIDSDYVVKPDWLKQLVPYFNRDNVGFVQAPQDHRAWEDNRFKEMCNWEYAGFFHIGMVHRNERNAIIQHGTMTLIRKQALEQLDGWGEWCICEDAELGLRLLEQGYESVYVNEAFGRGLTPDSFAGYKGQRYRWVYGAVQILRRHWRDLLLPQNGGLSAGQRYHFVTGWLPWFADGLHLLFTVAALWWTVGLLAYPQYIEYPLAAFVVPTIGMFGFKMAHTLWLYKSRVPGTLRQRLGAALAGMALTHTIARAIFKGLVSRRQPFLRTPKAQDRPALTRGLVMAKEEMLVLAALWLGASAVLGTYGFAHQEALLWSVVLCVQSAPYVAAVVLSVISALPERRTAPQRDGAAARVVPEPV